MRLAHTHRLCGEPLLHIVPYGPWQFAGVRNAASFFVYFVCARFSCRGWFLHICECLVAESFLPARGRVGLEVHRCLCIIDAGNVFISTVSLYFYDIFSEPIGLPSEGKMCGLAQRAGSSGI